MGSLIAGVLHSLGLPAGLAGDNTPYVPSAPVQIGTSGPRHGVPEAGSWQALMVMFAVAIVLGAVVLMVVVRQRTRLLERRRVRRMAEAVAALAEYESLSELGGNAPAPPVLTLTPPAHPRPAPSRTTAATIRTTPATPKRPAPNA